MLIGDVIDWLLKSGVRGKDELTTRYYGGNRKVVIRKDVNAVIKAACTRHGLDDNKFSTKSLRSGFATHYSICGGSSVDRDTRGGWTAGSSVPKLHYDHHAPKGAISLGVSSGLGLSISDMRRMAPVKVALK